MSGFLLEASDIHLTIGEKEILSGVSLSIRAGEIVTLIGPNGAGKTSLVRIVLGLQRASAGSINRQSGLRIGYMPQKLHIDASLPLTVNRFMQLAGKDQKAIDECLALTGVAHLHNNPMQSLSGGETQRVLLARALLRKPQLLVLDEPVQGVDIGGQAKLYDLIASIRDQQQCGVLMISHDLHLVMAATDTVVCLNQHVCCHGRPENVAEHPAYLEMFGRQAPSSVAVYTHHHDHDHDMHGDVSSACESHRHA